MKKLIAFVVVAATCFSVWHLALKDLKIKESPVVKRPIPDMKFQQPVMDAQYDEYMDALEEYQPGAACWSRTIETDRTDFPGYKQVTDWAIRFFPEDDGSFLVWGVVVDLDEDAPGLLAHWLAEFDSEGNLRWKRYLDQVNVSISRGKGMIHTADGGFLACGTRKAGEREVVVAIKIDADLNVEWEKELRTINAGYLNGFIQTEDNGYLFEIIDIDSDSENVFVRADHEGNILWERSRIHSHPLITNNNFIEDPERGFRITSLESEMSDDNRFYHPYISELDYSGNVIATEESEVKWPHFPMYIFREDDDGVAISGVTNRKGNNTNRDLVISRYAPDGTLMWENIIGGASSEFPLSIDKTREGGYFISALTNSYGVCNEWQNKKCTDEMKYGYLTGDNILFAELDDRGEIAWKKSFGSLLQEQVVDVLETTDGDYLVLLLSHGEQEHSQAVMSIVKISGDGECGDVFAAGPDAGGFQLSDTGVAQWDLVEVDVAEIKRESGRFGPDETKRDAYESYNITHGENCWSRALDYPGNERGYSVAAGPGGDSVMVTALEYYPDKDRYGLYAVITDFDTAGNIRWEKAFSGLQPLSVISTSDGYVVTGQDARTFGRRTEQTPFMFAMKLDFEGEVKWFEEYVGYSYISLVEIPAGGFAGIAEQNFNFSDPAVVFIDDSGKLVSRNNLVRRNDSYPSMHQEGLPATIDVTPDGAVYGLAPASMERFGAWRINPRGTFEWKKYYDEETFGTSYSVATASDGGVVIAGNAQPVVKTITGKPVKPEPGQAPDFSVVKVGKRGYLEWQKVFGGERFDTLYAIRRTREGRYIAGGVTRSFGPCFTDRLDECDAREKKGEFPEMEAQANAVLFMLDREGNEIWRNVAGGVLRETVVDVAQTPKGDYVAVGHVSVVQEDLSRMGPGEGASLIYKIDSRGECKLDF